MSLSLARKHSGYRPRKQYDVTPAFVAITWNKAASADEAAAKLGMPLPILLARVSVYRKMGIKMKRMPRKNSRVVDVDKINQSIEANKVSLVGDCRDNAASVLVECALVMANEATRTPPRRGLSARFHLIDGTADGVRIVERASSTIQALASPRSRFRDLKSRPEFQKPGVYLLLGEPDVEGLLLLYIGEGDPTLPRLEHHFSKKDFWTSFVLFTAKTDCLHKSLVQYLESRLTSQAKAGNRCKLENGNSPMPPTLSETDISEGEDFLAEVLLLSRLLGLMLFEPAPSEQPRPVQECRSPVIVPEAST